MEKSTLCLSGLNTQQNQVPLPLLETDCIQNTLTGPDSSLHTGKVVSHLPLLVTKVQCTHGHYSFSQFFTTDFNTLLQTLFLKHQRKHVVCL